jgi:arginine N-succinyltransferase
MNFRIRPARKDDFSALYEMAKLTGGGFTNLPPDKGTLERKLEMSSEGFGRKGETQSDDLYLFVLENFDAGTVRGTCQIFGEVGRDRPFYSYRISTLTQKSEELGRIFRNQTLSLCTDLEGSSEVGGLFLHPHERAGGLGMLLARSRYLFVKQHRPRFGGRMLAELRGVMDPGGHSPFWDALAGSFFGMTFPEADEFNAVHGTQFIADLMPKAPIYVNMLPESTRAVIGQPHPTGRAALKMLQAEGFIWDCYVDIFDGGPTVTAATDQIRTVREAEWLKVGGAHKDESGKAMLVATGQLGGFHACFAQVKIDDRGEALLDEKAMKMLDIGSGDTIIAVSR